VSLSQLEAILLVAAGLVAGVVNTLAGGGSLLTVPLLVLIGLPGGVANGTNRIGILIQSAVAAWRFRADGVSGTEGALPVLLPLASGSLLGAIAISRVADATFERLFGGVMLALLVPTLRRRPAQPRAERPWPRAATLALYFGVGLYGGAFQAGIGVLLLFALSHAGFDLVRANAIKMVVVAVLTAVAVPVFVAQGQVAWLPAGLVALGFALGGAAGARLAVRGGERLIRPVLAAAVLALAARMLGLY
jgi:uncharacterized membrane protein YfcA